MECPTASSPPGRLVPSDPSTLTRGGVNGLYISLADLWDHTWIPHSKGFALRRIIDWVSRASLLEAAEALKKVVMDEKAILERVEAESLAISRELDRLRVKEANLVMKLERTRAQIAEQEDIAASLPTRVKTHQRQFVDVVRQAERCHCTLQDVPGSDAKD
ncbi:hypothetical protein GUJ93_ZPchr0009g1807 [Zizania palustris]|uniref:Uncharacterized protein n=1 Tax=Zizania palustris TaxID=103762 RepID=A0A8J5VKZ3_ZIZPA|nr:hypothetical protein GUJ93_ZPchr0009g1807 [Zizania palustris]